jgi:CBS-domain-containing membrane protein
MNAIVRDVMTTPVVAVGRETTYKELAAKVRQHRVSAFPVVDDQARVIGVVSEADMLHRAGRPAERPASRAKADGITAGDLMTHPAVTVTPEDTVERAARLMYTVRVKRLPVVSPGGRLVGIIGRADVLAVFDRPDEEIRREITGNVILHEFLEDPRQFLVTVQAGVVTLEGSPETVLLGRYIVRRARHVRGVVAVRDRLSYPGESPSRTWCHSVHGAHSCA